MNEYKIKNLCWFSQHDLTNGQIETLKSVGINSHQKHNIIFNDDIVSQIETITPEHLIAIVVPLNYGLKLLRAGYTIIEFQNIPSARQRGKFLCKGMNVHTSYKSEFHPCPVPLEKQEEGFLNYK